MPWSKSQETCSSYSLRCGKVDSSERVWLLAREAVLHLYMRICFLFVHFISKIVILSPSSITLLEEV